MADVRGTDLSPPGSVGTTTVTRTALQNRFEFKLPVSVFKFMLSGSKLTTEELELERKKSQRTSLGCGYFEDL